MAKKKTTKKSAPKKATPTTAEPTGGKVRVELRFEESVLVGIKRLAECSEISVNQLMHGLAAWAVRYGRPGVELIEDHGGFVAERRQPGCVSMGEPGKRYTREEREAIAENADVPVESIGDSNGRKLCVLDFTVRRVVQED